VLIDRVDAGGKCRLGCGWPGGAHCSSLDG
jgi:hypothetical protein